MWEIRSPAARKHRVGPASPRRVMAITTPAETTSYSGDPWPEQHVGQDNPDRD